MIFHKSSDKGGFATSGIDLKTEPKFIYEVQKNQANLIFWGFQAFRQIRICFGLSALKAERSKSPYLRSILKPL